MEPSQTSPPQPDTGLGIASIAQDNANLVTSATNWVRRGITGAGMDIYDSVVGQEFDINTHKEMIPEQWPLNWKNRLLNTETRGEFYKLWEQYYFKEQADAFRQSDPVTSVATNLAYGVFDPMNLIPLNLVGKYATGTNMAARAAKGAALGGASLGALAGVEEAGFAVTSDIRTAEDTAMNLIASTAFGSVFGAAGGAIQPFLEMNNIIKNTKIERTKWSESAEIPLVDVVELPSAAGAFETKMGTSLRPKGQAVAEAITGGNNFIPIFGNAYTALKNSRSEAAKSVAAAFDNPGIGGEARTLLNARDISVRKNIRDFDETFMAYGAKFKQAVDKAPKDFRTAIGGRESFDKHIHRYLVSDQLTGNAEVDDAIKGMADFYSSRVNKIFDQDYLDALVKAGKAAPEDVAKLRASGPNYAAKYVARMYDLDQVKARPQEFKDMVRKNISADKWVEDEDFYDDLDSSVLDRILNVTGARANREESYIPRGLNPRKLSIQDIDLIDSGFLASDIRRAFAKTVHDYIPDTLLLRTFGDTRPKSVFGAAGQVEKVGDDLARRRGVIADEYAEMMRASPSEQKKILEEQSRVRDAIEFMFNDFRYRNGIFAETSDSPVQLVRKADAFSRQSLVFLKNFSSFTMLRSAAFRDLVQASSVLYREPVLNTTRLGLRAIAGNLSNMKWSSLNALQKQDLRAIGGAANVTVSRLNYVTSADYTPQVGVWGKVTKFAERAGNFSRNNVLLDGSNVVRDWMEMAGHNIATNRILYSLEKGQPKFLEDFGINQDMGRRILEQFQKHGASEKFMGGKYYVSGVSRWDDLEAADAMAGATWNFIRTITADGTFQQNAFIKNTIAGQVIGTFTGFINGMISRTLVPSINRSYSRTAFGLTAGVGLYAAGKMLSDLPALLMEGQDLSDEVLWEQYLKAGAINALGFRYGDLAQRTYFGLGSPDAESLAEGKIVGPFGLNPSALMGAPAASGMNILSGTAGLIDVGVQEARGAITGEMPEPSASSIRAIRNIVPFRNQMFMPMLLNEVEDQARDYYGLAPRKTMQERLRQ